jgi:hypothetical protein
MPPLAVADLDSLKCTACGLALRDHCTVNEGIWYYSPCRAVLLSLAPASWREQIDDGICQWCRCIAEDHFAFAVRSAAIQSGDVTTEILPTGDVICREAYFVDCRTGPAVPKPVIWLNEDGLPQGLGNPWHPRHRPE